MRWTSRTGWSIGTLTAPSATAAWLVLPAILLSLWTYRGVPLSYFVADDFVYLYRAYNAPLDELLLAPHGGHVLIARNLAFLLFAEVFGADPRPYFTAALLTHLLNVFLLFLLVRRMTASPQLAAVAATLWGVAKAHAGTLYWHSVYGQQLACAALLLLLLSAERWRARPPSLVLAGWYALAVVACTSFGTGLGVVMALPVALFFLARSSGERAPFPPPLTALALILPLLWLALHWRYDVVSPWNVDDALKMTGLSEPDVPLAARLIRLHAHWSILLMPLDLIGHGLLAVFDVPLAALPAPTWVIRGGAVLLVAAVIIAARRLPRPDRQRLIAVAILAASAYLSIALGRGQFFGALIAGGRLPFFGRYHYLPGLFLTVLLCLIATAVPAIRASRRAQYGLLAGALLAAAARLPYGPLPVGPDPVRTAVENAVADIRRQLASVPPGGSVDIPNRRVAGLKLLARREEFPGLAAIFVIFYPPADLQGRRVRFIERHASVVAAAQRGRRSRVLIVARASVPVAPQAGSAQPLQ